MLKGWYLEGLKKDGMVKLSQSNTVILNIRAGANTVWTFVELT